MSQSKDQTQDVSDAELDSIRLLLEAGESERARQRVEAILRHNPDSLEARCLLAQSYVQLGYAEHARNELESVLRIEPAHPLANAMLGHLPEIGGDGDDSTTNIDVDAVEDELSFDDDTIVVSPEMAERARQGVEDLLLDGPITTPIKSEPATDDERAVQTVDRTDLETIDGDIVEMVEEGQGESFSDRLQPRIKPPFKETLLKTPKLRQKVSGRKKSKEEDTFGTFNELSSSDLRGAEKVAREMGLVESPDSPGIDSYLERVIGGDDKGSAHQSPRSDLDTAPVDIPLVEIAEEGPTPRDSAPASAPSRPPESSAAPEPREEREQKRGRSKETSVERPSLRNQSTSEGSPNSGPGVVVDTGFDEDDPTINLTQEEARRKLDQVAESRRREAGGREAGRPDASETEKSAQTMAARQAALEAQARGGIVWSRVLLRAGVMAAVAYGVYLAAWFPLSWERRLVERLDERISEGEAAWDKGTWDSAREAVSLWSEAKSLRGSDWDAVESGASWWVEDVLGRTSISSRRSEARQLKAFTEAFIAARMDPGWTDKARQTLEEVESDSVVARAARSYALLAEGQDGAAWNVMEPIKELPWPSPRMLMAMADLEMVRGRPEEARDYALAAARLVNGSYFVRATAAEALAAVDPSEGIEAYSALVDDAGGKHAPAELRRAQLRRQLGEDPSADLSDLLNERADELSPRQRGRAHLELARATLRNGKSDEAEAHARTAIALDATLGEARAFLIGHYLQIGRSEGAVSELNNAEEAGPGGPAIEVRRAQLYLLQGRIKEAREKLNGLVAGGEPEALWLRGSLALEHGDIASARVDFQQAARLLPSGYEQNLLNGISDVLAPELSIHDRGWLDIKAIFDRLTQEEQLVVAWALLQRGEHLEVAASVFSRVQEDVRTHPSALAGRCAFAVRDGVEREILKRCSEAVALAPSYTPAIQAAALGWMSLERYTDAFDGWQKVVAAYPNLVALRGAMESSLLVWDLAAADEVLNVWLSEFGASPEQYYWAGRLALQRGRIDEAREYLGRAAESEGALPEWRPWLATAHYESGSFGKAREVLEGLKSEKGARGGAALVESQIALSERAPEKARESARDAKKWLTEDEASSRLRSRAVVALAEAELAMAAPRVDVAAALLRDAIKLDDKNLDAHYQLGLLERSRARLDAARASFERALEIYPQHEPSKRALAGL